MKKISSERPRRLPDRLNPADLRHVRGGFSPDTGQLDPNGSSPPPRP